MCAPAKKPWRASKYFGNTFTIVLYNNKHKRASYLLIRSRTLCSMQEERHGPLLFLLTGSMWCVVCVCVCVHLTSLLGSFAADHHPRHACSSRRRWLGMNYFPEVFAAGMGFVCLGCARRGLGLASASIPGVFHLSGGGGKGGGRSRSGTKTLTQQALLACGSFIECKSGENAN